MRRLLPCTASAALALILAAATGTAVAQAQGVPLMKPPIAATPPAAKAAQAQPFKTITWEALVPKDWDPFAEFKGIDLASMQDGDPRTNELMKRMREVWDRAPVNTALVGQQVRIPGFVVPLEDTKDGIKEFLLVPYFGACVHSPPPPSNQIIHVLPKSAVKNVRSMDAVWITGTLSNEQTDSYMGAASWRLNAVGVVPYEAPKR
ncbi:hypothetical protein IP87_20500 [beta proteobacterium AAP121]|nr:hypothetical protein IP80_12515 [beta proteobacterium AAP65]KPF93074.1 hypothetical protein IP87_20500 [beta proteobacterium AAP121]